MTVSDTGPLEGEMIPLPEPGATLQQTTITDEIKLPSDQLLLEMKHLYPTSKTTAMPDSLVLSIKDMNKRALTSNEPSKKLYDFSRNKVKEKKLRIVTQIVPDGILPNQYKATLFDVKVGGHGPDDKIYNENADIRNSIPRGTTLMSLKEGDNEEVLDVVLYANKKFTGGIGDEDETQPENNEIWRDYCLNNTDEADKVVVMDKLNGEAAHFSGRFIGDKFYVITGSKNVHMLLSCEEDIDKYEGDRFKIAKAIAKAVWKHLTQMKEKCRQTLFSLLHHTKCTIVFEILQPNNQHIVNLSHLKEPLLYVVCVTPTVSDNSNSETSLTALPPHHCLELFESLGFTIAPYKIIERTDVDNFIKTSRKLEDSEGHVLYYIMKTNGYENTIGMSKTKTIWYVILRALREKAVFCFTAAKKKNGWSLEDRILSTHKRFKEIQIWLKFSDEYLAEWNKVSTQFMQWLNEEINTDKVSGISIRPDFPKIIANFQTAATGNKLPVVR